MVKLISRASDSPGEQINGFYLKDHQWQQESQPSGVPCTLSTRLLSNMCFDSLCGDIFFVHSVISSKTSFLTKQSVCACFSAFVYKLPITHSQNITPRAIAFAIKMKPKCTGKKGKRHLSGTFIIPKSHGTASIFDEAGRLYAHPSWASRGLRLRC